MSLLLIVVSSCAKFEEGSNFSLLSAKSRLVNTWKLTKYEVNGTDQTTNNPGLEITFNKDETFKRTFILGLQISEDGTWSFGGSKSILVLTKANGEMETYTIVQLKNKDFKARRIDNGTTYTYTFTGK